MANDDDDLRINTLNALTKHSSRAVLEEHSSCEVPAGCGGVVLRWRDPTAGRPGVLQLASLGRMQAWLDGHEVVNSWVTLAPGRHVLAVAVHQLERPAPFMALIQPAEAGAAHNNSSALAASGASLAWRVHPSPPDGWTAPDFDDGSWQMADSGGRLVQVLEADSDAQFWHFRRLGSLGAQALRLEAPSSAVRGTFIVGVPL